MIFYIVAAIIVAADQAVKYIVRAEMAEGASFDVIPGLLSITHVENAGAAFGILEGQGKLLLLIPVIVIIVILFYLRGRETGVLEKTALCMIAAGGAGNLIDRAVFGEVTDMISVSFFPPVFNVADIFVTVGVGLLVIGIMANGALMKGDGDR